MPLGNVGLKTGVLLSPSNFELRLPDPLKKSCFHDLSSRYGTADLVTMAPPIPCREALAEMLDADGRALLQGVRSNPAIRAELYKYVRAGRRTVALIYLSREAARMLLAVGIGSFALLREPWLIGDLLHSWHLKERFARSLPCRHSGILGYSRQRLAADHVRVLDEIWDAS